MKRKVVVLKKLVLQCGVRFLIRCILDQGLCHLVDFLSERDVIQQNGLQGPNQFWFIVSRTCCNFSGELVTRLFHFKRRLHQRYEFCVFELDHVETAILDRTHWPESIKLKVQRS